MVVLIEVPQLCIAKCTSTIKSCFHDFSNCLTFYARAIPFSCFIQNVVFLVLGQFDRYHKDNKDNRKDHKYRKGNAKGREIGRDDFDAG